MSNDAWKETFVEQRVTYVLEHQGRGIVIEHVPARVCEERGERLFAPDIVEDLQRIAWEQRTPSRVK